MTETEKHVAALEDLYDAGSDSSGTALLRPAVNAAIKALRACEKIRALCAQEREAYVWSVDLDTLEGLLP